MGDKRSSAARSRLFLVLEGASALLQKVLEALATLRRNFNDIHRKRQEALRTRQNALQELLESVADAIVVTDAERRLVATNPKALDLFGISEFNLKHFTVDAFLSYGQIPDFCESAPLFKRREERYGSCTIRRLDGNLRFAEYIFVPYVVPRRHLFRFFNVVPQRTPLLRFVAHYSASQTADTPEPTGFYSEAHKTN
jgi:PAS domain S-box-containing protein